MKIEFTSEDLDAIEVAYIANEGYLPCYVAHIPKQKEYQILQKLWLRMANKIESNAIKKTKKSMMKND